MEDLVKTESLMRLHLESSGTPFTASTWTLSPSALGGRGVFATRDLDPGDLVFMDPPLVLGPRAGAHCPPLCVGCYSSGGELVPCSGGCGLPVCGRNCERRATHREECDLLVGWRSVQVGQDASWCPRLLRAVTAIRCLSLDTDQRRLVRCLQTHSGTQHETEVEWIKQSGVELSIEDEEFMRVCCRAMDANAFEVEVSPDVSVCPVVAVSPSIQQDISSLPAPEIDALTPDTRAPTKHCEAKNSSTVPTTTHDHSSHSDIVTPSSKVSLRGLYPLSAMMNHTCTPNTRHGYDVAHRMIVRATTAIPRGTEIYTSYSALLWGTPVRRHHLASTKHFLCVCARCRDPQEFGSRLAALRCADRDCPGSMLPLDPIKGATKWTCNFCELHMPNRQACLIQASLGQLLSCIANGGLEQLASFLGEHRGATPTSNQLVVEMKTSLVWALGHRPGYHYPDLSEEDLDTKTALCRELLLLLETLGAGQCRMRGLLLYELQESLMEQKRRSKETSQELEVEALTALEEVLEMFVGDVTSPAAHAH